MFCTPALQRPLELGADLVIHSATKYLDGQGRVIAGAVAGSKALVGDPMTPFLRTAGPTLSPFNAWVVLKGLETLELRMRAQSAAALELARWLEAHPSVARVHYPGLESHPQHALARRQQRAGGAVLSFEVKGGRAAAWRVIDSTRLVSITANLGRREDHHHPPGEHHARPHLARRRAPRPASPRAWCAWPWASRRCPTSRRIWSGGWIPTPIGGRSIRRLPGDSAVEEKAEVASRRWAVLAQAALVAAAYFAAAKLALLLAIPPGYATAIWPRIGHRPGGAAPRRQPRSGPAYGSAASPRTSPSKARSSPRR